MNNLWTGRVVVVERVVEVYVCCWGLKLMVVVMEGLLVVGWWQNDIVLVFGESESVGVR